jgi:Mn-dependent DtxR family transcriptional regulator
MEVTMNDRLLVLYLRDVNTLTEDHDKQTNNKMSRHHKLEKFLIKVIGITIGIYTFKIAVEQLVMQLRL